MIQRIQSVYLVVAIILIAILFSGINLFEFQGYDVTYKLNAFGLKEISAVNGGAITQVAIPFFILMSLLVVLLFLALISFKQLKRQLAILRFTLLIYFVIVLGVVLMYVFGDRYLPSKINYTNIGWGIFLLSLGFPLTFLAYNGVRKDKNLLDSLNRLR
ncbi:MAG: DUF4293 family protein [Bacteroidota bacterium]